MIKKYLVLIIRMHLAKIYNKRYLQSYRLKLIFIDFF